MRQMERLEALEAVRRGWDIAAALLGFARLPAPGDCALVCVIDEGDGMRPEILARALVPHSRPSPSMLAPDWVCRWPIGCCACTAEP